MNSKLKVSPFTPFWLIPVSALLVLAALYGTLYRPLSTLVGAVRAVQIVAVLFAVVLASLIVKIFRAKPFATFLFWGLVTLFAFFSGPTIYEGNQNWGRAGYYFGFQLTAALCIAATLSYRNRKITPSS